MTRLFKRPPGLRRRVNYRYKYGRWYQYRPRWNLLQRLSRELGWPVERVYGQMLDERVWLLRQKYPGIDFQDYEIR